MKASLAALLLFATPSLAAAQTTTPAEGMRLVRQMADAAAALGVDPYTWILAGGDDHALAATFPPAEVLPPPWRPVGQVLAGSGVTVDGRGYDGPAGWDHFR